MTLKIRILPSSEPYFKSYVDIHFFFQSHSYSRSGNVSLSKDNMVWTTSLWGHQFKVEFDIKVTKPVLPETWYSVFHLTKGEHNSQYGDRIPAVFVNKNKYFLICSGLSGNKNLCKNLEYQPSQWYHFEILQEENSTSGKVMYTIKVIYWGVITTVWVQLDLWLKIVKRPWTIVSV